MPMVAPKGDLWGSKKQICMYTYYNFYIYICIYIYVYIYICMYLYDYMRRVVPYLLSKWHINRLHGNSAISTFQIRYEQASWEFCKSCIKSSNDHNNNNNKKNKCASCCEPQAMKAPQPHHKPEAKKFSPEPTGEGFDQPEVHPTVPAVESCTTSSPRVPIKITICFGQIHDEQDPFSFTCEIFFRFFRTKRVFNPQINKKTCGPVGDFRLKPFALSPG